MASTAYPKEATRGAVFPHTHICISLSSLIAYLKFSGDARHASAQIEQDFFPLG